MDFNILLSCSDEEFDERLKMLKKVVSTKIFKSLIWRLFCNVKLLLIWENKPLLVSKFLFSKPGFGHGHHYIWTTDTNGKWYEWRKCRVSYSQPCYLSRKIRKINTASIFSCVTKISNLVYLSHISLTGKFFWPNFDLNKSTRQIKGLH